MITENLKQKDLRQLVDNVVEIDSYASKMGNDEDIITVTFSVTYKTAADDLIDFIESGYQFVMDADQSNGELADGKYRVFAELARDSHAPKNIEELLYGVGKLADINQFKFKYYKSFKTFEVSAETLARVIPSSAKEYRNKIDTNVLENYEEFFKSSMLESISMPDDTIMFKRAYRTPLSLRFISSGDKLSVMESITDRISINPVDVSEILFLTKYVGNYNITKFGKNTFVFENKGHAVVVEMR